ncbi:hypothetical protein [Comamonas sp. NoAH]|uniref:terminase small subunit-like protein n=1 Tax=Comamonas halotolerans TaxID=3041496 RepID=UPI0024E10ED2|nr:hypothetical protein [Comamonas sp. NoAH]
MATTKQSTIPAHSAQSADWAAIERAYSGSRISVRQLAAEHGVSHTAIGKKAHANGWERPAKLSAAPSKQAQKRADKASCGKDSQLTQASSRKTVARVGENIRPSGHHLHYSQALGDAICERLVAGESLRSICKAVGMPHIATVMRWLADPLKQAFCDQYTRAREMQMDFYADELAQLHEKAWVPLLDEEGMPMKDAHNQPYRVVDKSSAALVKLEADNKKWLMSKLAPKKYGDKLALGGAADLGPLHIHKELTDAERAVRLARALNETPQALQALAGALGAKGKA